MQRLPLIFLCLISGLCFHIRRYIHLGRPQYGGEGSNEICRQTVKKTADRGGRGQKLHKICGDP